MRALEFCELRSVDKENVNLCFREFPEVQTNIHDTVNKRIEMLLKFNRDDCASITSGTSTPSLARSRSANNVFVGVKTRTSALTMVPDACPLPVVR